MSNTSRPLRGDAKCRGRSVTKWTNGFGSLLGCSKATRWPRATRPGLYVPSARTYRGLPELEYPFHDHTHIVTRCGRISFDNRKINLSTVFAAR
jgi:hypothetical protein